LPDDQESALVLAGDVGKIRDQQPLLDFLQDVASRFRTVLYVMGNH